MISTLFNTILYEPFYNGLIFLVSVIPGGDVGIAVILLTIAVKLALFSVSYRSIQSQVTMRELEPEVQRIKEQYKNDRQQQGIKMMELYKQHKINPFAGFLLLFVQIPVILALYFVFLRGGLPEVNTSLLYGFIKTPEKINMIFIGLLDISQKSLILAVLAGVSQYFQAQLMMPAKKEKKGENITPSFKDDLARSMSIQMRYVLPVVIGFFAYRFSAAVALYWVTSNVFGIAQEMYVKKHLRRVEKPEVV